MGYRRQCTATDVDGYSKDTVHEYTSIARAVVAQLAGQSQVSTRRSLYSLLVSIVNLSEEQRFFLSVCQDMEAIEAYGVYEQGL